MVLEKEGSCFLEKDFFFFFKETETVALDETTAVLPSVVGTPGCSVCWKGREGKGRGGEGSPCWFRHGLLGSSIRSWLADLSSASCGNTEQLQLSLHFGEQYLLPSDDLFLHCQLSLPSDLRFLSVQQLLLRI